MRWLRMTIPRSWIVSKCDKMQTMMSAGIRGRIASLDGMITGLL
jgi:hypothetical protein